MNPKSRVAYYFAGVGVFVAWAWLFCHAHTGDFGSVLFGVWAFITLVSGFRLIGVWAQSQSFGFSDFGTRYPRVDRMAGGYLVAHVIGILLLLVHSRL
jgi:hypothetical protein